MESETRYIIFDEDVGTDDAWALFMILKAEQIHNIKVIAITCVRGNASLDNVAINTMRVLKVVNRTDVSKLILSSKTIINLCMCTLDSSL